METDRLLVSDYQNIEDNNNNNESNSHRLRSSIRGESAIEKLALKIATRRANRIPVTFDVRVQFLTQCHERAQQRHDQQQQEQQEQASAAAAAAAATASDTFQYNRLHYSDVVQWKQELEEFESRQGERLSPTDTKIVQLLTKAIANMDEIDVVPKNPFLRNNLMVSLVVLMLFYVGSAVVFCVVLEEDGICPTDPDASQNRPYYGWISAIYFASVTMSTVGYGDLTIYQGSTIREDDHSSKASWRLFVATIYQPLALLIAATVFATAAEAALEGFDAADCTWLGNQILNHWYKRNNSGNNGSTPLYVQVRRIFWYRVTQLLILFLGYNILGILAFKLFVYLDEDHDWSWMKSFYWAIQTTTTIGYGDLDMPFEMRWFQIFYTTFGTALVGGVFAGVSSLTGELQDIRRFYAWERREVSKRLIEDLKGGTGSADGSDNNGVDRHRIDQYEFMVGSLLMLNKIQSSDVEQIMNKFRSLAGDKGYIVYEDDEKNPKRRQPRRQAGTEQEGQGEEEEEEEANDEELSEELESMIAAMNVDTRKSIFAR